MSTVFLTGGTGFVGSHVLRELRSAGYGVRALVRNRRNLESNGDGVDVVTGDLTDTGSLARALEGCRYVVHCAAVNGRLQLGAGLSCCLS